MSPLLEHHRDHLHKSGLADDTIDKAGIYSVTDPAEAAKLLRWRGKGPAPAIALPVYDVTGKVTMTVLRPDKPFERKDGTAPKYETPQAEKEHQGSVPLYFPPAPLVAADAWTDTSRPIILTEGIKKALSAAQAGQLCIAGMGVTLFHDLEHREQTKEWRLHPDLKNVPLKGRVVYVCFDSDLVEKPAVALAEARLVRMLLDAGAIVRVIRIPAEGNEKVGLDDYLVGKTDPKAALVQLMESAVDGDPILRAHDRAAAGGGAAQALLDDLGFLAALSIGDLVAFDLTAKELKTTGITKKAVEEKLEEFRERQRATSKRGEPKAEQIDPAILEAAEALLRDPTLMQRFLDDLAADGLVGEHDAARSLFLVMATRKTKKPIHAAIKAASSTGKNWLVDHVTAYLPEGDYKAISDLSPKALLYLPESLNGKVVVITEAEGAEKAEYTTRLAMSERKLSVLVTEKVEDESGSRMEAHHREVEVSSSFIFTTTRPQMHSENETRLLELTLDESQAQTDAIVHAQAEAAANPPTEAQLAERQTRRRIWQTVLGLLEPKEVRIPQAKALADAFPKRQVRARRDFPKLLGLVAAHALLHQRQRRTENGYLVAEQVDIDLAKRLCSALSRDVPPKLAKTADLLVEAFGSKSFTPARAAMALGCAVDYARRLLKDLEEHELAECLESSKGTSGALWAMLGATVFKPATPPAPAQPPTSAPTTPTPAMPPPVAPVEEPLPVSPTLTDISEGRTKLPDIAEETSLPDRPTSNEGESAAVEFPGPLPDPMAPRRYEDPDFGERAAIMEYDGGLSREIAEEEARRLTRRIGKRPPPEPSF